MLEWWSYRPRDFLLFSESVYWRLFELANDALWPWPLVALALGTGVPALAWSRLSAAGRFIAAILATALIVTGWAFLWRHYRPINWVVTYVAPLFALEALLLLWLGAVRGKLSFRTDLRWDVLVGWALFAYALVLHPLTALVTGRPLRGAEAFAVAPDPTVVATLGLLATAQPGAVRAWLLPLPVLWCLGSGATLSTLGTWEAWLPLGGAALTLVAVHLPRQAKAHSAGGPRQERVPERAPRTPCKRPSGKRN
ncbi:DUF6064 family protein [Psychromarinibacter sp. C21-152]|uniref:DUF6064 family protein n=1 Tax=Psychromarinibacter sediminicola TaxID=3033385 RepID=A0AAE3NQD6_9RHOB|nr:DUF6064 family protein [Psychromarinibacter sediminicola]MDF0600176.1 DUF6064 family protein [Psychromarinibacter sediminicola]